MGEGDKGREENSSIIFIVSVNVTDGNPPALCRLWRPSFFFPPQIRVETHLHSVTCAASAADAEWWLNPLPHNFTPLPDFCCLATAADTCACCRAQKRRPARGHTPRHHFNTHTSQPFFLLQLKYVLTLADPFCEVIIQHFMNK